MNTDKQKGVSLIITFFIMIIILSVVLSISILLYSEIKVIRNIGNSVVGFYAADSGIEKVLYYDKQVLPPLSEDQATGKTTYVKTGLCSIFSLTNPDGSISSNYCTSVHDHSADESIYCDPLPGDAIPVITGNDCDPSTCTDCEISFGTSFGNGATYTTTAKVYPSGSSSIFEIESKGNFRDAGRQIEALNTSILPKDVIQIENACMTPQPPSYSQGEPFFISADVSATSSTDRIGTVTAIIK
ncbi:MAG: hypothetical protein ABSF55_02320, partial [Candidatus Staskawiczbacteria bacterium]